MPRAGDWRGPGGDKWLDYHKIVSVIQASLEQNLTDGEIRKFFGVHPLVELTAAKRRRLARLKARQVLAALRSGIIAGLVENPDKGVRIDGFVRFRARQNVGYGAIKPRGILYATDGGGMILQRSQLVERNYTATVGADTFRGDFPPLGLISDRHWLSIDKISPSLGPNNEPSPPGIFAYRTWQKIAIRDVIDGKESWVNADYYVDFAFLGMLVFNPQTRLTDCYLMDKAPVLSDYWGEGDSSVPMSMTMAQYADWAKARPAPVDAWSFGMEGRRFGAAHADRYADCFPKKRWFFRANEGPGRVSFWATVDWIDNYRWWELNGHRLDKIREWGWFIPPDPKTYTERRTGYVTAQFEPGILPAN